MNTSSFILETTLDTKTPHVIELLGPASKNVQHQVAGTLNMVVLKPVQLKQLSVTFLCDGNICSQQSWCWCFYVSIIVRELTSPVPSYVFRH